MESKYNGIDSRIIKCCDSNPDTIEAGISFDEDNGINILNFHFLSPIKGNTMIDQVTKSMHLNKENTKQLIECLKELKF